VASEFHDVIPDDGSEPLPYVHYEDFISLSNQGTFRLDQFLLDRQRRWARKVIEEMSTYGYQNLGSVSVNGEQVLHFGRTPL